MEKVEGWRPLPGGIWIRKHDGALVKPTGARWLVANRHEEIATGEDGQPMTFDSVESAREAVDFGRTPKALGLLARFEE